MRYTTVQFSDCTKVYDNNKGKFVSICFPTETEAQEFIRESEVAWMLDITMLEKVNQQNAAKRYSKKTKEEKVNKKFAIIFFVPNVSDQFAIDKIGSQKRRNR